MSALRDTALRLPPTTLGAAVGPIEHRIDARWLMAYAAVLGETDPRYFDTEAALGPLAHPLFPVCYEWPLAVECREKVIGAAIAPFSVHAEHDLVLHRLPRAGDRLTTTSRIVEVRPLKAGTLVVGRYDTVDASGAPVSTTHYGSIYRGVSGDEPSSASVMSRTATTPSPGRDASGTGWETMSGPPIFMDQVEIAAGLAHVYTECARIWNPIHTDLAAARAAGLPGLILHGTALLALAVSRVIRHELGGDPARVRGLAVRFTGMVPMPSVVTVRGYAPHDDVLPFDAVDTAGRPVLGRGVVKR
jgi:acyl dehydratase